jgi:hypothetical protein
MTEEHMTPYAVLALGIPFSALLVATGIQAGPLEWTEHSHQETVSAVHEAEHDVDHAWEVYHRAALGGTVSSPGLQAEIEEHLHEARILLTQAQEVAEHGDKRGVMHLIGQIKFHTTQAIGGSKEQKK